MAEPERDPSVESAPESTSAPRWRRLLVVTLLVLVGGSIGARVFLAGGEPGETEARRPMSQRTKDPGTTSLVPDQPDGPDDRPETAEEPPRSDFEKILPFLTEGGISMLLGLALGMATRAVFKLFMFGLVLFFIAIQYLAFNDILTVDWGAFADWLRSFVLNLTSEEGPGSFLQHKLPAAGSFVLGYYLGLKR